MKGSAALNKCFEETQVSRSELIQGDSRYKAIYKCLRAEYERFNNIFELDARRARISLMKKELDKAQAECDRTRAECDRYDEEIKAQRAQTTSRGRSDNGYVTLDLRARLRWPD
eukprot:2760514-Heterocapsa_arctica.AAC.1